MKKSILVLSVLAVFFALQGSASAKEISGKVTSLDAASSKLSISYINPETQLEDKADLLVKPETVYTGIATFSDLKAGQDVTVDVTEDTALAAWVVNSLKVSEEAPAVPAAAPAEAAPAAPAVQ